MNRLFSLLRLCRFPTVFTALADIAAGFLLCHAAPAPASELLLLLGASAGIYLSGMVFNDLFDVQQDARERPGRPLPAGQVTWSTALIFGSILMLGGVALASLAGPSSLWIALILCGCVLAYDGLLKRTPLGPAVMGSCRFFNVLLGASTAGARFVAVWQMPQLWMAAAMGIYIVGVTWFARREAQHSSRGSLIGAVLVMNAGLAMLALWIGNLTSSFGVRIGPGAASNPTAVLCLWGVIVLTINRRAIAAILNPVPERVQPAVGTMLLSIIVLDAMAIYYKLGAAGTPYAMGTLALLIPAILLRRSIPLT